jgi:predicted ATPase with chaperone activity
MQRRELKRERRCSRIQIQRNRQRISGPLLAWIDLYIEVPAVEYRDISSTRPKKLPPRFAPASNAPGKSNTLVFIPTRK